jgi:hypothetical protein
MDKQLRKKRMTNLAAGANTNRINHPLVCDGTGVVMWLDNFARVGSGTKGIGPSSTYVAQKVLSLPGAERANSEGKTNGEA